MLENLKLKQLLTEVVVRDIAIIKPRGRVIELCLHPQLTKFNLNDYVTQSKKSRRTGKFIYKEKPTLQYSLLGKCLFFRKKGISSSFTIRNVLSLSPFEMHFALFASIINAFAIQNLVELIKRLYYSRVNHYELRTKSPRFSQNNFFYVLGLSHVVSPLLSE